MNYVVFGGGDMNSLDREHITNTMFEVAKLGKRVYICTDNEIGRACYGSLNAWKGLNKDLRAEAIQVSIIEGCAEPPLPEIIDFIILFISKEIDETDQFIKTLQQCTTRVKKYILGTWDSPNKNTTQ